MVRTISDELNDRDALHHRLHDIFVRTFELDSVVDVDALRYRSDPRWDSLGHMALVAAIEEEFDIEFTPQQVLDMESFEVVLQFVRTATADAAAVEHG